MPVSVRLDKDKCKGCTTCVKHCPTEAIRVRFGIAKILEDKCIDCGQCVRTCPQHAKKAVSDPFSKINDFKYKIVLPAPSLYAQFKNLKSADLVLAALLKLGFDDVYEPAAAAEVISELTKRALEESAFEKPMISSACPTVTRLIRQCFPNLLPHVSAHLAPVELAAKLAREKAKKEKGLKDKDIGVFFITPCPAKITEAHYPMGLEKPIIDYALPMNDIYVRLLPLLRQVKLGEELPAVAGPVGNRWAAAGGEAEPIKDFNVVSCDGLENVMRLLEDIEDEKLPSVDYFELNACTMGCVGGCLTVENPFVARARLHKLEAGDGAAKPDAESCLDKVWRKKRILHMPTAILDADFGKAMDKLRKIEALKARLPGLDCGACGTPGCASLAQDVVMGYANESDCIFKARESMSDDDDSYLPPPFRRQKQKEDDAV